MSTIKLKGSSSGEAEVTVAAAAGTPTFTLPTTVGSANQLLKNSGTAGTLEFSSLVEDSSGNVGIGTAPDNVGSYHTLHIKGPSGEGAALRLQDNGDTADSNDAAIYKNQSGLYLRVNGTDPLIAYMNGADRFKVESSGNATVTDGDLVIGTAGHGIDFAATSDATGKSNELLDDYEEGSWTPAIQGLDNTPTYYNLVGKYTKIGNIVKCQGFIQIGGTKASFANTDHVFKVAGLPYAVSGVGYSAAIGNCNWQGFDWVGASQSTYGHNDDTQLTAGIVSSTVNTFRTMGQREYYMGEVKNVAMDNKGFILEWDMTYFTAT